MAATKASRSAPAKAARKKAPAQQATAQPKDARAKDAAKVDDAMAELEHPFKAEVEALRRIVKAASPKVAERWKWKAPSYHVDGHDLSAFNLWQREYVQLVLLFRHGIPPDPSGLLEGDWKDKRTARFDNMADVRKKKAALTKIVKQQVALALVR